MSGLHVVMVPSWWPSAAQPHAGIFFQDYARAFAAAGAKVGVIVPELVGPRRLAQGERAPLIPRVEEELLGTVAVYRIRGLHTSLGLPALHMRRFRAWARRGLAAYREHLGEPDVLLALCALPAGWACTHLDDPLAGRAVISEHTGPFSLVVACGAGGRFAREAFARAAAVVSVSVALRDQMRASGIGGEILVCGNAVSPEFVLDASGAGAAMSGTAKSVDHRRGTKTRRLLFVGRLTREKGVAELIESIIATREERELHWDIVGEGPMRARLDLMLDDASLSQRVSLHGFVDRRRLIELMDASTALVFPSHFESFGLVVAEALCRGLPVVTTSAVASASCMTPSDGIVVPPEDAPALAQAVRDVLRRASAFDRGDIARRAAERHSPAALAAWYAALFRRVARGQSGGCET